MLGSAWPQQYVVVRMPRADAEAPHSSAPTCPDPLVARLHQSPPAMPSAFWLCPQVTLEQVPVSPGHWAALLAAHVFSLCLVCSPRAPLICQGLMPGKEKHTSPRGGCHHWLLPPLVALVRTPGPWQHCFLPIPSPSALVAVRGLESRGHMAGLKREDGGGGHVPLAQGAGSRGITPLPALQTPRGDPWLSYIALQELMIPRAKAEQRSPFLHWAMGALSS